MKRRPFLRMLAACALLAACTTVDAPAEPAWGKQPCAHCAMVVSERRFGAQLLTRAGDRFFFDDPGCMVVFMEQRGLGDARAWVFDASVRRWVDAKDSHYGSGSATPMDFGFEANRDGAIAWSEMRARVLEKGKVAR